MWGTETQVQLPGSSGGKAKQKTKTYVHFCLEVLTKRMAQHYWRWLNNYNDFTMTWPTIQQTWCVLVSPYNYLMLLAVWLILSNHYEGWDGDTRRGSKSRAPSMTLWSARKTSLNKTLEAKKLKETQTKNVDCLLLCKPKNTLQHPTFQVWSRTHPLLYQIWYLCNHFPPTAHLILWET